MYGIPIYRKTLGIEVQLSSIGKGAQNPFPDNPIIRAPNVLIECVEIYTATQLTITPSGLTTVTDAGLTGLIVNLADNTNFNRVFQLPAVALNVELNNGVPREFEPFKLVMQKSFIQITDATNLVVNQAVYVNISYFEQPDQTKSKRR